MFVVYKVYKPIIHKPNEVYKWEKAYHSGHIAYSFSASTTTTRSKLVDHADWPIGDGDKMKAEAFKGHRMTNL